MTVSTIDAGLISVVQDLSLTDQFDGSYRVKFRGIIVGEFGFDIRWNGTALGGSPFAARIVNPKPKPKPKTQNPNLKPNP